MGVLVLTLSFVGAILSQDQNYKTIRQKANRLSRQYQLPSHLSLSIARGEISLREGLRKNMVNQRALNLENQKGLSRSDALQVARGELELEDAIYAQAAREHLARYELHSLFTAALEGGQAITLYLHQLQVLDGVIVSMTPYEITFKALDSDEEQVIHKLQIKAARLLSSQLLPITLGEQQQICEPIEAPRERFRISSKHLYYFKSEGTAVSFSLLEGLKVSGVVSWVGRFEFALKDCHGDELICFRHALAGYET